MTAPLEPPADAPVSIEIEPEDPQDVVPVEKSKAPDIPAVPESCV